MGDFHFVILLVYIFFILRIYCIEPEGKVQVIKTLAAGSVLASHQSLTMALKIQLASVSWSVKYGDIQLSSQGWLNYEITQQFAKCPSQQAVVAAGPWWWMGGVWGHPATKLPSWDRSRAVMQWSGAKASFKFRCSTVPHSPAPGWLPCKVPCPRSPQLHLAQCTASLVFHFHPELAVPVCGLLPALPHPHPCPVFSLSLCGLCLMSPFSLKVTPLYFHWSLFFISS